MDAVSRALLLLLPVLLLVQCSHHPPSLHFYFHDTVVVSKSTAVIVATRPATPKPGVTKFGELVVFDDPITEGPSEMSKQLGSAQGIYVYTGRTNESALWTFTAFLDTEDHTGSLTITGVEPLFAKTRELAVVFGTGDFHMARGVASVTTVKVITSVYFTLLFNISLSY